MVKERITGVIESKRPKYLKEIIPLVIRGGEVEEILNMVGDDADPNRVINTITRVKESARASVGYISVINIKKGKSDNVSPTTSGKEEKINFARLLFQRRLIPNNISCARELIEFCEKNEVVMPNNFYDMLRLEMFYGAVILDKMGDPARLEAYSSIGNEVDPEWFAHSLVDEERFIEGILNKQSSSTNTDGGRVAVAVRDGSVIYDTLLSACSRQEQRWGMDTQVLSSRRQRRAVRAGRN